MAAKRPAKKAAAKKPHRGPKRQTAAQRRGAEQDAALRWAVNYRAPLKFLEGWDPKTGTWAKESKVAKIIADVGEGATLTSAAREHGLKRAKDLIEQGREYLADETVSEDRTLIPLEVRAFTDFVELFDEAEGAHQNRLVKFLNEKALEDPRFGLAFLARRHPDEWREQQEIHTTTEMDPRRKAVNRLLQDPKVALEMADFARRAADLVDEIDD